MTILTRQSKQSPTHQWIKNCPWRWRRVFFFPLCHKKIELNASVCSRKKTRCPAFFYFFCFSWWWHQLWSNGREWRTHIVLLHNGFSFVCFFILLLLSSELCWLGFSPWAMGCQAGVARQVEVNCLKNDGRMIVADLKTKLPAFTSGCLFIFKYIYLF